MVKYTIMISGVHYGANGDLVAGQKDTPEMHKRTHELLEWLDRERPIVVMGPDPCNNIHKNAIIACSHGQRIGRVAKNDVNTAWDLLRQSGNSMLIARVSEVIIKDHGYVMVTLDADELKPAPALKSPDSVWQEWMQGLPQLPFSKLLEKEEEAVTILDNLFMPNLAEADKESLKYYIGLWIEGSHHDLSYEASQKRSAYIRCLESAQDKDIRLLAEPLKEQNRKMCERAPLDEHATVWWKERKDSPEVKKMWHDWKLATEKAMKYWKRLMEQGFVDNRFMLLPTTTRQQAMYIAEPFAEKLGLKSKWKPFEDFWGIKNLAQEKWNFQQTAVLPLRHKDIDKIFED